MTEIEYDEMFDQFYFRCVETGCHKLGRNWDQRRDAELDADRHDELHDDGAA